jgi:hypothetical protein
VKDLLCLRQSILLAEKQRRQDQNGKEPEAQINLAPAHGELL